MQEQSLLRVLELVSVVRPMEWSRSRWSGGWWNKLVDETRKEVRAASKFLETPSCGVL